MTPKRLSTPFIWRRKMARHDPVVMTVVLLSTTESAILITTNDDDEGVWLPRSKVEWERKSPMFRRPEYIEITMPEWLAMDRGLI